MIRFIDATRLAITKLRTRKVRLVITVVIAGLLFGVLAAASQVSRGAFASLAEFDKEGFGKRYIIAGNPIFSAGNIDPFSDPAVVERAEAIQKDLVARKTAEAKKLGLEYNAKDEALPVDIIDTGNDKIRSVNINTPAGRQAIAEYSAGIRRPSLADLKKLAEPYRPISYYESHTRPQLLDGPRIEPLKDGKEQYDKQQRGQKQSPEGFENFETGWGMISRDLLKPFMLPGTSATIGKDGSIPIIAPYSSVEKMLGLQLLPSGASPVERLERIKEIRTKASDIHFQICYRNSSSVALLDQAIAMRQELERNKNNKEHVKPSLQYGLPTSACGAVPITSDTRTAAEKQLAEKQQRFDKTFGKTDPEQAIMNFRVIGIASDPPFSSASATTSLISTLVSSNLGYGAISWYTPLELQDQQPQLASVFKAEQDGFNVNAMLETKYVEFNSAATARSFMDQESCNLYVSPSPADAASPGFNPAADCEKIGKVFMYMPFGSNALALESVKNGFNTVFGYAALGVAVLAAIIMIGTVGRIIADSRRETAVFRAIGARKSDIALIYLIYTAFLSALIFGFAMLIGFAAAQMVDSRYSAEFTVQALVSYNSQDLTKSFSLYAFHTPDILRLLELSLAGGLLSASFPLLRNLRRNPIRDMRDDT